MTESLADRMQLCKDRYNDIPQCLIDEVRALENKMTDKESLADRILDMQPTKQVIREGCLPVWTIVPSQLTIAKEVRALVAENAIYKERLSKPYKENKMAESLTGRLINLFHRCDSTIRLDSISLTDEVRALEDQLMQLHEGLTLIETKQNNMPSVTIDGEKHSTSIGVAALLQSVSEERDELKAQLAEYKYTPQSYDEMWKRVKEEVNENDELKAQLEKFINNRETDSN